MDSEELISMIGTGTDTVLRSGIVCTRTNTRISLIMMLARSCVLINVVTVVSLPLH